MVDDGRVQYGFPYPPLSLAMAWPGHLAGDFRYAELAALVARRGVRVAAGRASAVAVLAAAVLLFTPRAFFALEQAWTEPFAHRLARPGASGPRPRAGRWRRRRSLGLAAATKQYLVLAMPLPVCSATIAPRSRRAVAATVRRSPGSRLLPALADLPGFLTAR